MPRRMRVASRASVAAFALAFVLAFLACSARAPAPSPGVEGYDDARLQVQVHSGLKFMALGPCRASLLLGVLDDEESGKKLDVLLERSLGPNVEATCAEWIAVARIVRLGRLGELDLQTEMLSPSPLARAVALRYSLGTQTSDDASRIIVMGMADEDPGVRIVAYRAAAVLGGPELTAALTEREAEDEFEEFWRCTALSRLDASVECGEAADARTVVAPGEAEPIDRCERARKDLGGPDQREALWFFLGSAFRQRAEPLDRIEATARVAEPCLLDDGFEDEVLSSPATAMEDQAIVAATILWRRHEAVGLVREKRVQLREVAAEDALYTCGSDQDCTQGTRCARAPGPGRRGVCGRPGAVQDRPRATVYVTVGSNACWSFMDCPAFYSCYYPDRLSPYGVCVY